MAYETYDRSCIRETRAHCYRATPHDKAAFDRCTNFGASLCRTWRPKGTSGLGSLGAVMLTQDTFVGAAAGIALGWWLWRKK